MFSKLFGKKIPLQNFRSNKVNVVEVMCLKKNPNTILVIFFRQKSKSRIWFLEERSYQLASTSFIKLALSILSPILMIRLDSH